MHMWLALSSLRADDLQNAIYITLNFSSFSMCDPDVA